MMQIYSTEESLFFNIIPQHSDAPVPHWHVLQKAGSANGFPGMAAKATARFTAMESLHPRQDGINAPVCSGITLIITIFK
jgi:hypothetical protein